MLKVSPNRGQARPVTERGGAWFGADAPWTARCEQASLWYALRVRSNHERRAAGFLRERSFEVFCPSYQVRSRRRDRKKLITQPLFPGYLFIKSDLARERRLQILRAPGSVGLVGFGKGPEPLPEETVNAVRIFVGSGREIAPFPYLSSGKRVRVVGGPLAGLEAYVLQASGHARKVAVSVELLGRTVVATVQAEELGPNEG